MKSQMDLTNGNLFKKLWLFAIPLIFSGLLQLLYNACDLIVCGQFGSEHAVGAISSTNSLVSLMVNLFLGLSVGANVCMATAYGAKDEQRGDRVLHTSMMLSIILGIIVTIIGLTLSKPVLRLMNAQEETFNQSANYLKIYFCGSIFVMVYNFGAAILRACGDSKRPFIFLALSGLANVLLNLLFVIVFKLDVNGVAIATVISQAISAILVVITLCKNKVFFRFVVRKLRLHGHETKEIIVVGLAAGLQSLMFSFCNVLIQASINSLGPLVVDGSGASTSIEGFIWTAMNQTAQAAIAAISANYGARNYHNIKKILFYAFVISFTVWLTTAGISLIFRNQLLGLYLKNKEARKYGIARLVMVASTYWFCGIMDLMAFTLRGIGHSYIPTFTCLLCVCGSRIFWVTVMFKFERFHNLTSVVLSWPISWILTDVILATFIVIFFKKLKNQFSQEKNIDELDLQ